MITFLLFLAFVLLWCAVVVPVILWRPSLRIITRENNTEYLYRWALRPQNMPGLHQWRIYLHKFLTGDGDGHHNHPWRWSFSIVLRGSYTEEYFDAWGPSGLGTIHTRQVSWLNVLPPRRYHRIVALHPATPGGHVWTLFFCGPLSGRSWGFWMPGRGHVPWKVRLAERGLAPLKTGE